MRTVIEFQEFVKKADRLIGSEERDKIVSFLAFNPKAGKELEHFGGIRKLEWRNLSDHNIYFHPGANNLPLVIIGIFRRGRKMIHDEIIEILIHAKTANL